MPEPAIPTVKYDFDRSRDFNPHTGEIVRKSIKWTFRAVLLLLLLWGGWFVYGRYFDPAGRIAWKKEIPLATFHLIENRDGKLTFLAGGTVWEVNSADGTAVKRSETPQLNWYQEKGSMWPVGKSAALFGRENKLARFDFSGKLTWEKTFEAEISDLSVGDRAVLVVTVKSQLRPNPRNQFDYEYIRTRRLLNLADGAVLQEKTAKPEELFFQEFLLGTRLFRIEPAGKAGEEKGIRMTAMDPLSGKEAWRLTTADRFTWGPVQAGELLLFKLRETLHALRASDGAKRWSMKKIGDFCGFVPGREWKEGYFSDAESLCRVDLVAGREVWRKPLAGRALTGITADRVYLEGATEEVEEPAGEKERKLPNAYEKLAKEDVVIRQILQAPRRPSVRVKRTLACLDAASGEELWRKPEIQGELIADNDRALIYWDSASSGMLSMVNQSNVGYTMLAAVICERMRLPFPNPESSAATSCWPPITTGRADRIPRRSESSPSCSRIEAMEEFAERYPLEREEIRAAAENRAAEIVSGLLSRDNPFLCCVHPAEEAAASCRRCGRPLCFRCFSDSYPELLCPASIARR